jgi:hypothetical protein
VGSGAAVVRSGEADERLLYIIFVFVKRGARTALGWIRRARRAKAPAARDRQRRLPCALATAPEPVSRASACRWRTSAHAMRPSVHTSTTHPIRVYFIPPPTHCPPSAMFEPPFDRAARLRNPVEPDVPSREHLDPRTPTLDAQGADDALQGPRREAPLAREAAPVGGDGAGEAVVVARVEEREEPVAVPGVRVREQAAREEVVTPDLLERLRHEAG